MKMILAGKSWRPGFVGSLRFYTRLCFEGRLKFFGNELAILENITESRDPTFKVLLLVEQTIDAAIDGSNHADNTAIDAQLGPLNKLFHTLAEISDCEGMADGGADCPAAPTAVQV